MITRLLWMLAGSAVVILAQGKETPAPRVITGPQRHVVVEVKNGDVNRIGGVVSQLGASVRWDTTLRVIAVGGDAATVNSIEEAIKRMDVAPGAERDVEVTMYLLYASAQEVPTATVPSDLDSTVKQLRGVFPYKSYRVLDASVLRGRDGERASVSGTLPGSRTGYSLDYDKATISGQSPRMLRIDNLRLTVNFSDARTGIQTNLDAREGQKTVVGKANMASTEDAIFLVVTPKVVE
jgi:hypothetical protein